MKYTSTNFRQMHRRFRHGLLAGVLMLPLVLVDRGFALDPARSLQQYNCRTWSRQNGLPANGITSITQTRDGYLWLGTSAGLVRFDGNEFKLLDFSSVTNVSGSTVTSLASARNGGIWVGLAHSSFGFCDGQSFSFRGQTNWGGLDMNVRSILESEDGALWFAAENGVTRLTQSGTFEQLITSGSPTNAVLDGLCGYQDRQGRLWFGTPYRGLYYWQAGTFTKVADPALDAAPIFCIAEDREGQIWVGTADGLHCLDSNLRPKAILPLDVEVRALLVDDHDVLWIGTAGRGLGRYRDGACEFFQKADGLGSDFVNALAEDREGSLWVGTRGGVSQLTDVKFPTQPAAENPSVKDALAVCASHQGGVWIGSPRGVTYFDPATGTRKTYGRETGLPDRSIKRVFEASNGDLYLVCYMKTLAILSPEKKILAVHTNSDLVVGMAEDAHGVVVSVAGELYRAGTNYFQPYAFTNAEKPPMYWILNLASGRDGVIWVASAGGIFRVKDGAYQQWPATEGVTTPVLWICEDNEGVVWGATMRGIVRLKDNRVSIIDRKHGLFDDNIYAVIPDDLGNLWVDSNRGIFSVSRQDVNDFADGKTARVQCTVYDGMDSVKLADKTSQQEHVACKTSDGRIWFPEANGVVMIDPAHIPTNRVAPQVHIDLVKAEGRELARGEDVTVPPGKGELEFHFDALTFIAPQNARFRYRLEGYDKDWVDAGDRRLAFYTNLKPGPYTFRVIAANADGVWNTQGDAMAISLRPHYYQTGWFHLFCGVLALAALGGSYAWRVRHLMHKQRALQKARDLLEAEVASRTRDLATANASLQHEEAQLKQETRALAKEIEERKRMELENRRINGELLEKSRQAGMAEIATNVLHNIGNVLNSVNVSAALVADNTKQSKLPYLGKAVALLNAHAADLDGYLSSDPKGRQLPDYLGQLARQLDREQQTALTELDLLRQNIEHIKDIVAMQQNYAKISGVTETVKVTDLVEDALRMNAGSLVRHDVHIVREYADAPMVTLEKHHVLQILVNLIRNAKYACDESGRDDKRLKVQVSQTGDRVRIAVVDNGVGISAENRSRIFNHGFTTRKGGHGFGLHSGALAAKEMGGSLTVHSDGIGRGATFTLELPRTPNANAHE
jgi:ligand-binding sensor domain-containing protein/signal transduction histidine kinase